jgi:predicted transcriptional regulator
MRLAMAAAGDIPLHFFSEGDSATRATAVEMGDPTHRFYRQRQRELGSFLVDLAEIAYRRHLMILRGVKEKGLGSWRRVGDLGLSVEAPDISRDNKALAEAARGIVDAFSQMREHGWITDEIAIRLAFKFAGELLTEDEVEEILNSEFEDSTNGGRGDEQGSGGAGEQGSNGTAVGAELIPGYRAAG